MRDFVTGRRTRGAKSQSIKLLIAQAVWDPVTGRSVHAVQGPKVSSSAGSRNGETCTRCAAVDPSGSRHGTKCVCGSESPTELSIYEISQLG